MISQWAAWGDTWRAGYGKGQVGGLGPGQGMQQALTPVTGRETAAPTAGVHLYEMMVIDWRRGNRVGPFPSSAPCHFD